MQESNIFLGKEEVKTGMRKKQSTAAAGHLHTFGQMGEAIGTQDLLGEGKRDLKAGHGQGRVLKEIITI